MGFSIGGLLKTIAGPIIGGLVGGPVGAIIGGGITAGFGPSTVQPGSSVGPTVSPAALPAIVTGGRAAVALAMTAAGVIAELLLRATNNTGRRVTKRQVIDSVRVCGLETTAGMFGLSVAEVCQIVISKRRRRARGISAADLRRTRSTIRKVHNISHDLRALVPRVRAHHR